jgi:hypothetical protein
VVIGRDDECIPRKSAGKIEFQGDRALTIWISRLLATAYTTQELSLVKGVHSKIWWCTEQDVMCKFSLDKELKWILNRGAKWKYSKELWNSKMWPQWLVVWYHTPVTGSVKINSKIESQIFGKLFFHILLI